MKAKIILIATAVVCGQVFVGCKKEGCTNSQATNYNAEAKKDDGSCILPEPKKTTEPKKKPSQTASSDKQSGATSAIANRDGKSTNNVSSTSDSKSKSTSGNDITYQLGAYGWVTGDDPEGEIAVLVIADAEEIIMVSAVLTDADGYYEFDWTLTQDADKDAPFREMVIFTYNDEKDELCDITDDFNYDDFNDIVSDTEGYYEAEDIDACDWD